MQGLWTPLDPPLEVPIHRLITQFVQEIDEGEAREEIWSSLNYLFLHSSEPLEQLTSQARHCVIIRSEQCPWAGVEQSIEVPGLAVIIFLFAKVTRKRELPKECSPARSCFKLCRLNL